MMAQVTIELRHVLNMDGFDLFDFDYQISDSNWKEYLEKMIIDKYYFYEIGYETIDRWKHAFEQKLRLIMPYYDELYNTTLYEYDPLITTQLKEEYKDTMETEKVNNINEEGRSENTSSAYSSSTGNYETVGTDYPHTSHITTDIPSDRSKTDSISSSTSGSTGETSNNTTSYMTDKTDSMKDYLKKIEGFTGNKSELLQSYRKTLINVTNMVLEELKSLFILVY